MSIIKSLKTLSTKDLGYSAKAVRALVDGKGAEKVFLARIGGVVTEIFTGESKHGEFSGVKGLFFAVNAAGERFTSDTAFLPTNLMSKVKEGFSEGVLQIDLPPADIFAVESDKNASGYAYLCNFTMTDEHVKKADTIANSIFNTKLPQLAAPVKEESKIKGKAA